MSDPGRLEQWAYAASAFGQNLVYGISITFVAFAFTDILGIAPGIVGVIFFATRAFDALNDPLMGVLADRTRHPWGRYRPWLAWTPLPIAILSVLPFLKVGGPVGVRIVYAIVVYLAWGVIYTMNDIPLWALSSALTDDTRVRTTIIARARGVSMVGLALPPLVVPWLAHAFSPGRVAAGYSAAVATLCAAAVPLMLAGAIFTRERVATPAGPAGTRTALRLLLLNRPLQLIVAGSLFNSLTFVAQATLVYFVTYNLNDPSLLTWFGAVAIVAIVAGVAMTPMAVARIGKRRTVIWTGFSRAVLAVALFGVGYGRLGLTTFLFGAVYLLLGPWVVLQTSMIGDAVDYGELVTGTRAAGLTFSFQTLLAKANAAIGGLAGSVLLATVGYRAGVLPDATTRSGIFAIMTLLPAAGSLLSSIPFIWYGLGEEEHRSVRTRLTRRRARREAIRRLPRRR